PQKKSLLKGSLKQPPALPPADLVREDLQHCNLSFRSGLPYFERTLGLFRGLGHGKLAKVPSAYLKIVADHAERSAAQFDEILRFTGEGLANPQDVRSHLIGGGRDYYRQRHDDLFVLVIR